jgi:hypothetical protein
MHGEYTLHEVVIEFYQRRRWDLAATKQGALRDALRHPKIVRDEELLRFSRNFLGAQQVGAGEPPRLGACPSNRL